MEADGPRETRIYPLDGRAERDESRGSLRSVATKWEGAVLLSNILVSGNQSYTVMERWKRSRDGNTLTIKRTILRGSGETESVLVYENRNRSAVQMAQEAKPAETPDLFTIPAGTRILLRLVNSVDTKHSGVGDRIYLETAMPVARDGRMLVPAGSWVAGTVMESQRPGRVAGRGALTIRFDSLTLNTGVVRDLRSHPGAVDGTSRKQNNEGRIEGENGRGRDAATIAGTTATGVGIGAGIGSRTAQAARGAGIGAAAGAAAGLVGVLLTRGPELVLPKGSTMEMVLDRDLQFTAAELGLR